jgi:tetratricopeptide (TPR) repeat protein
MNSESTLSDALTEIDVALAASDNERAAGLASELLLAYPNAVGVLRQRARALAASGRSLQAAEVHRRVLEILPADGDAMAGLAHTLHAAGQTAEAREAAQWALDYLPGDERLKQLAAGDGLPFQPDEASMQLRKSLAQSHVGLLDHGIAGLRSVVRRSPDRADAKIALMQALWRHGSRIGAAEQAQTLLDDYPNCLNAHVLLLELWRDAGAGDMERVHQTAIEQVDPDHRVMRGILGTQSPLPAQDVPARPALPTEPAIIDEDPLAREDWVDNLLAESRAAPKPLEVREPDSVTASDATGDPAEDVAQRADEDDFVSSLLPLEWSAASDLSEAPAQDDFIVPWIDGNVKEEWAPARPRNAVPDPRDGVPEELPPLEWEAESGAAGLHDVDAPAKNAPPVAPAPPLKPLVAAGAVAAAVQRAEQKDDVAPESLPDAASQATAANEIAAAAPPESAPPHTRAGQKAAQAMNAEVASASVKPMPVDAVERVDEDMRRWDEAGTAGPAAVDASAPATDTPPAPAARQIAAPATEQQAAAPATPEAAPAVVRVIVETEPAIATAQPKAQMPAPNADGDQGGLVKAVAAAVTLGAVSKKRKKREAEDAAPAATPVDEPAPAATPAAKVAKEAAPAPASDDAALAEAAQVPATLAALPATTDAPADEPVEPAAPAARPAKAKAVKKPPAKPAKKDARDSREVQTEKIRKTYERAIATVKREELPKLIADLNKAAEVDADNKLIHELLGQAYNRQGNIPAAINAYRKALELADRA